MADRRYFSCWLATIAPVGRYRKIALLCRHFNFRRVRWYFRDFDVVQQRSVFLYSYRTFSGYDAIYLGFARAGRRGRQLGPRSLEIHRGAENADQNRTEIALAHIAQFYAVEKQLRENDNGDWKDLDRAGTFPADSRRTAGSVAARPEEVG